MQRIRQCIIARLDIDGGLIHSRLNLVQQADHPEHASIDPALFLESLLEQVGDEVRLPVRMRNDPPRPPPL
jgi:hypothetical protein